MNGRIANLHIAIVGPCAAGKSTLANGLQDLGLRARQIVQEHSYVPEMWQHFAKPDVLIFLDASYEVCTKRKKLNWLPKEHAEQLRRLKHAREHCQIYVYTDDLTPGEVLFRVLNALEVAYHAA
jgi:deoxyadenosine/deoxycytidine kinase